MQSACHLLMNCAFKSRLRRQGILGITPGRTFPNVREQIYIYELRNFPPSNFPNEVEVLYALILTRLNTEADGRHQWAGLHVVPAVEKL